LDLVCALPDGKARQQHELDLQIALGQALIATRGYTDPVVGETYTRARCLCEILGQDRQLLLVMFGEWLYHVLRGELVPYSVDMTEKLLCSARKQDDAAVEYLAHTMHLRTFWVLGALTKARSHGERALGLYNPTYSERLAALTAEDPQCATLVFFSLLLVCLGYLDQARAHLDEAVTKARAGGQSHIIAYAAGLACFSNVMLRNRDALSANVEDVLASSRKYGLPFWEAWGTVFRGYSLAQAGLFEDGIELIRKGSAAFDAIGMVCYRPFRLIMLAEAYGKARQPAVGLKQLAEAAHIIEVTQEREFEAELYRVSGELLTAGDPAGAEDHYGRALAVARKQQAKFWELRASTSLARLWRDQGKRNEARELLAPIYGWFTEGFDTPDLKEAATLLAELA
jgi:predicted ATPase